MSQTRDITVTINGETIRATVPVRQNLADFLRNGQGLTGTHVGCEHGVCGACTLLMDDQTVRSCLTLAVQADGATITTIEGMGARKDAEALKAAFTNRNALQCGYCTPGMLASALEYIESGAPADRVAIREHISGNYCRCTGYQSIVDAICDTIEGRQS